MSVISILPDAPRVAAPTAAAAVTVRDPRIRVCIAGSREYGREADVVMATELALSGWSVEELAIVSGMARGPDTVAYEWAKEVGFDIIEAPANWDAYGRGAGAIRNGIMCEISDALIAFWDGTSPGTRNMINLCVPLMPVLLVNGNHATLTKPSGATINYNSLHKIRGLNLEIREGRSENYQELIGRHAAGL